MHPVGDATVQKCLNRWEEEKKDGLLRRPRSMCATPMSFEEVIDYGDENTEAYRQILSTRGLP